MRVLFLAVSAVAVTAPIFPPLSFWPLAFIALVPLLLICKACKPSSAFFIVFCVGLVLENIHFYWIYKVEVFTLLHGCLLGTYFALYWGVWGLVSSLVVRSKLPLILQLIAVSSVWAILDFVMANADFLAFPWNTLAHSQYQNKWLLQWASVFGEYAIAFVVVATNFILFSARRMQLKTMWLFAAVFVVIHIIGGFRYHFSSEDQAIARIASIQPSFLRVKIAEHQDPERRLQTLLELTEQTLSYKPDLVVWPEAAIRGQGASFDERVARIQAYALRKRVAIVFGYVEDEKYSSTEDATKNRYNQAILVSSYSPPVIYNKRLLMPFSEVLPHKNLIRWPKWISSTKSNLKAGTEPAVMQAGLINASPIICWENLFSGFVRTAVSKDTNLMIDVVNDNWFGNTPAPYQHNVASIFRAVENQLPMVISSNTGPSQIISSKGSVLASANAIYEKRFVIADVPLSNARPLYYFIGDIFVLFCALFLVFIAAYSKYKKIVPS